MKQAMTRGDAEKRENLPVGILVLSAAVALIFLSLIRHCEWTGGKVSLVGRLEIEAVESDSRFTSERLMLFTDTDRYLVEEGLMDSDLAEYTNERVKVRGKVKQDEDGLRSIEVTGYRVLH